jgi:RNA recognition motif-containing protein
MAFFATSNNVSSKTIFVGNLSIYCTEKDVSQLFIGFGMIESIHLKTSEKGNLSYCFIKYGTRQAAEAAIQAMNNTVLLGRPLR